MYVLRQTTWMGCTADGAKNKGHGREYIPIPCLPRAWLQLALTVFPTSSVYYVETLTEMLLVHT